LLKGKVKLMASQDNLNNPQGMAALSGSAILDLVRRVREGEQAAEGPLYAVLRDMVGRMLSRHLRGTDLQRICDASDVQQSVLLQFDKGLREDQWRLETADQLRGLVWTMALNKLREIARREQARVYKDRAGDPVRRAPFEVVDELVAAEASTPSEHLMAGELLGYLKDRLPVDLHAPLDLRLQGATWREIGERLGRGEHALQVKFTRHMLALMQDWDLQGTAPPGKVDPNN
jgi:hypothetical protein